MRRRSPPRKARTAKVQGAALLVLHKRVAKLERAVFGVKERIGFQTDCRGDGYEQDEDDPEIEELP